MAVSASTIAIPISSAISGPVFEAIGYYGVFSIGASCVLLCFLYLLFFVTETVIGYGYTLKTIRKYQLVIVKQIQEK